MPMLRNYSIAFPPTPSTGATVEGPDGQVWEYDGVRWGPPDRSPAGAVRIGTIMSWNSDVIPVLWLPCLAQAISRTTYAKLFAVIGTRYGTGNGSTTFNLPDHRSRLEVGRAAAAFAGNPLTEVDLLTLGATFGSQFLQSHSHSIAGDWHGHGGGDYGHGHGQTVHGHSHGDPGHEHWRGNHTHGLADPGHGHGAPGGGHSHSYDSTRAGGGNWGWVSGIPAARNDVTNDYQRNTDHRGTGVYTHGSGVGAYSDWGGNLWLDGAGVGTSSNGNYAWIHTGYGSLDMNTIGTNVSINTVGLSPTQNVQPCIVVEKIIFAGA